jgi:PAS domain S-box-containing protein
MTDKHSHKSEFTSVPGSGQGVARLTGIHNPKAVCKVLIVDDSPEDRADLRRMLLLGSERRYQFSEAETGAACLHACFESGDLPDCVILDYQLPDYDTQDLMLMLGGLESPCCPVLVVTGSLGRIITGTILSYGAQDFISKNWINPESLTRAVENSIERYWLNQELKTSHKRLKAFVENSALIAWMKDEKGRYIYLSENFEKRYKVQLEDWRGKTDFELWPQQMAQKFSSDDLKVLSGICALETVEEALNPDGSSSWWLTSKFPFRDQAGQMFVGGMAVDITERKQAELALQESEEFNRSILNNSADCIKVIDLEGNLILMNAPGLCAMEIDDFAPYIGKPWASLWPCLEVKEIEDALLTARLGGIGRFQGFCQTAKGTPKWWDVVVTAALGPVGQPKRFISISRDITERKQAEEALQASAAADAYRVRLSDALRPLSDPAQMQGEAARVLGEHLLASRVHYAEVINEGETGVVQMDYRNGVASAVGSYLLDNYGPTVMTEIRGGRTLVIQNVAEDSRLTREEKALTTDLDIGAYILVPLVKDMVLVGLLAVHQDKPRDWSKPELALIEETAQRVWDALQRGAIEKKLRSNEERLNAIVHQAKAGLAEKDLSGRFILVNEQFCQLLGRSREELLSLSWQDITHPDDITENDRQFQACVCEGKDFNTEKRYLRPDGNIIWVHNNMSLLQNDKGQPKSVVTVSFDIGERREIEAKLREKTDLLEEASRQKDEFLAMLGHELRNPLTPISNVAQLLHSHTLDGPALAKASEVLVRNVGHISHLVDDLLDVSRITRGLIKLKLERVELVKLLKDSAESIQNILKSKQQALNFDLPAQPVYVDGDPVRLAQVFSNLLINAAKYTQDGGCIELITHVEGPSVIVRFRDNGIGIEPNLLPHIFELFTQGKRGLDRSEGGLGLGLTLVNKLVNLHGGQVTAFSQGLNQGSEFVVKLPLAIDNSLQAEPAHSFGLIKKTEQDFRVLMIDDNEDVLDSISLWLEMEGHQVETASDGKKGISVAQSFAPDLVLLDIGLPEMDGYQIAKMLRELPGSQGAMIVALSGYSPGQSGHNTEASDFDHYLLKPPKLTELKNLISKCQNAKKGTRQTLPSLELPG